MRRIFIAGIVVSLSLATVLAFDAELRPAKEPLGENAKPLRNADGSYSILLESMRQGQVTEITPDVVFRWGAPKERVEKGVRYWVIRVDYRLKTVFGKAETSAEAWIKDGRVVKWVYTASGEVVP